MAKKVLKISESEIDFKYTKVEKSLKNLQKHFENQGLDFCIKCDIVIKEGSLSFKYTNFSGGNNFLLQHFK